MPNRYRTIKDVYEGSDSYRVYTQSGMDQGDICQWDADSRYATRNHLASGSIFLGVAEEAHPMASLGTTSVPLTQDRVRIKSQGLCEMKTTDGETYSHLDPVFQNVSDSTERQRVTRVSASRMIGRIHLPDGSQVTGTGNNSVNVRIFGSMTNCGNAPSSAAAAR